MQAFDEERRKMLDFTKAPPGVKEYAELVRNLTNEQLIDRISAWPERNEAKLESEDLVEVFLWTMRIEIEELHRRLRNWIEAENVVLPKYSGPNPACPKCEMRGEDHIKTWYHAAPQLSSICDGRLESCHEHLHRMCQKCGYEWLEGCANAEQPALRNALPDQQASLFRDFVTHYERMLKN
jgi:hypothetical protein